MFCKREDGMGLAFLPYELASLLLAVLLTLRCGVTGWLTVPVLLGWWLAMFVALFAVTVIILWFIALPVDMKKPVPEDAHPFYRRVMNFMIVYVCRFSRIRTHVTGLDKLPEGRYLFVSNHRSGFDPICTVWAFRKKNPISIITKPENHRIPIAGPVIYQSNFLPINREDPREAMKTIQAAAALLKNDVVSVGVYHEGTRNKHPEDGLLPFHNGVFKIAQKAEVPMVVASVTGTEKILKNTPWGRTEVYLRICEVIPPEELRGSTAAVGERVREIIESGLAGEVQR